LEQQESERRAWDEDQGDEDRVVGEENKEDDLVQAPATSATKGETASDAVEPSLRSRDPRRGSVSISVFGQTSETSTDNTPSTSASLFPLSPLASAASKTAFYHSLVNPESADTLISEHAVDDGYQTEEDHVTRMQTIAGRNNILSIAVDRVGGLLSRSSTQRKRARRSSVLPPFNTDKVVIGVSVERVIADADSDQEISGHATVYAEGSRRPLRRGSWLSMPGSTGSGNLVTKAKGFKQKFRPRSKPEP